MTNPDRYDTRLLEEIRDLLVSIDNKLTLEDTAEDIDAAELAAEAAERTHLYRKARGRDDEFSPA